MIKPSEPQSNRSKDSDAYIAWGIYGTVGFQLAATVVGGLLAGRWFDNRFGTTPWLTLTGLIAGSIGGFYNLIRIVNWHQERKKR